jgi:hypothetical protein
MKPWPIFEVRVDGRDPFLCTAPSRDKACYQMFQAYREHYPRCTFGEWLRMARFVRLQQPPVVDGYAGVRQRYGVDPRIGERRALVDEGPNTGRLVRVIFPGLHTSMIHCHYEGCDRPMVVHPLNAVPAP